MASSLPLHFASKTRHDQAQCPLFSVLPDEIRDQIFAYALSDYEDFSKPYEHDTCYRRPGCLAPRRSDTALLSTCQRIYEETWSLPWTSAEHTMWLAWGSRRPEPLPNDEPLERKSLHWLAGLIERHGSVDLQIAHLRIFAQLCYLEDGQDLSQILDTPHLRPSCITITVRHTDWWAWENDRTLRIGGCWVNCRLPDSVRELHLELESLARKSVQIDSVAAQAVQHWRFRRRDGVVLVADPVVPASVTRWSGSSTWEGQRWSRDETEPGILDYYSVNITFRPSGAPIPEQTSSYEHEGWVDLEATEGVTRQGDEYYDTDDGE